LTLILEVDGMGQVGNVFDVLHGYDINVFVLGVGRLHSFWDYKTL